MDSSSAHGVYYLQTNGKAPFGRGESGMYYEEKQEEEEAGADDDDEELSLVEQIVSIFTK
jgi:hypothetical protein